MSSDGVENPYRPPGAVTGEIERPSRRIGWKLYAVLLAVVVPLSLFGHGAYSLQVLDVVDTAVTLVGVAGLFGFAFRRRLARSTFWRGWLAIAIGWDMLMVFVFEPLGLVDPANEVGSAAEWVFAVAFSLPFYVALFRYGFRSREMWRPQEAAAA